MSVNDAMAALQEETGIFAYLPVANFVFLLTQNYSNCLFWVACVATLTSSIVYVVISGEPALRRVIPRTLVLGVLIVWLFLTLATLPLLFGRFTGNQYIPQVLFFVTLGFLSLLVADFFAERYFDDHSTFL